MHIHNDSDTITSNHRLQVERVEVHPQNGEEEHREGALTRDLMFIIVNSVGISCINITSSIMMMSISISISISVSIRISIIISSWMISIIIIIIIIRSSSRAIISIGAEEAVAVRLLLQ